VNNLLDASKGIGACSYFKRCKIFFFFFLQFYFS